MEWLPLIVAALIIGIAKTSFGGLGSVAVALMALVMPTKESTAAGDQGFHTENLFETQRHGDTEQVANEK